MSVTAYANTGNDDAAHGVEGRAVTIFEDVIVFDANRPARGESIFEASTHRRGSSGYITGRGEQSSGAAKRLPPAILRKP